ncbi:MAG: hypothetical protein AAB378_01335 [Patescibacteria group bacterium]
MNKKYGVGPLEEGWPVGRDSMVYIFGSNLKKFLKGDLELDFVRNVSGSDVGDMILRTQNGVHNLFIISKVPCSCFVALAENMGFTKVDELHYTASFTD